MCVFIITLGAELVPLGTYIKIEKRFSALATWNDDRCVMPVTVVHDSLQKPSEPCDPQHLAGSETGRACVFISRNVCGLQLLLPESWVHIRHESTDQNNPQANKRLGETKNAYRIVVDKPRR